MSTATTNRRKVLLGLAAASTAAATNVEASAAENPELVELGNQTQSISDDYVAALKAYRDIYNTVMKKWPRAPKEICGIYGGSYERAISGAHIDAYIGSGGARFVGEVDGIRDTINNHKRAIAKIPKTKPRHGIRYHTAFVKKAEQALPLAEAYWSQVQSSTENSGFRPARRRKLDAMERLMAHVGAIMEAEERTMLGVVIKAQALEEFAKVETIIRQFAKESIDWPTMMAAAILRQAGRAT